jgi:anti-anti-sigma factor
MRFPVFRFEVVSSEDSAIVRLMGELDAMSVGEFTRNVLIAIRKHRDRRIVVDLSELSFIDAAGVRAVLSAWQTAQDLGVELTYRAPGSVVARVFDIVQLKTYVQEETPATKVSRAAHGLRSRARITHPRPAVRPQDP